MWKQHFYFCIGWKDEDVQRWLKKVWKYETNLSYSSGKTLHAFAGNSDMVLIWTRKRSFPQVAHECVHAANFTLKERGYKVVQDNDESLAYFVEELCKQAIKK